jgi:hypothetical protein
LLHILLQVKSQLAQLQALEAACVHILALTDLCAACILPQVESQLSEHAARLEELKALEDAYLPVWLSRKMDTSFKYASDSWQQVQESEYAAQASEYAAQAATAVKPHWEWLKDATAPAQVSKCVLAACLLSAVCLLPCTCVCSQSDASTEWCAEVLAISSTQRFPIMATAQHTRARRWLQAVQVHC